MRIVLAYPYEGHEPDETVDLEPVEARRLLRAGRARLPVVDDEPSVRLSKADVTAYATEHGVSQNEARRQLRQQAAGATVAHEITTLPATPANPKEA